MGLPTNAMVRAVAGAIDLWNGDTENPLELIFSKYMFESEQDREKKKRYNEETWSTMIKDVNKVALSLFTVYINNLDQNNKIHIIEEIDSPFLQAFPERSSRPFSLT